MGNFSFIYNDDEIEDKVIESLSKTKLEYLLVTHAKIMDEDDELIEELENLPLPLQAATMFEWQTLLVDKATAAVFSCTIYDPNTLKTQTYSRQIKKTESIGMFNSAVQSNLKKSSLEERVKLSIKHNVLTQGTALIAFEKICEIDASKETEFVKVPLNQAIETKYRGYGMELYVKTLTGKTITLYANGN